VIKQENSGGKPQFFTQYGMQSELKIIHICWRFVNLQTMPDQIAI